MELNKAIRKQKKSYKRFKLTMCFIFFMLPLIALITNRLTTFFISYLLLIEISILIAAVMKANYEAFDYSIDLYNIKLKNGMFSGISSINCEKIELVHAEEEDDGIDLIIMMSLKCRNGKAKPIDEEFLRKYAELSHEYGKLKRLYPEREYFYMIIKNGGFKKYKFLIDIYKKCVRAKYTKSSIENIKEWMSD